MLENNAEEIIQYLYVGEFNIDSNYRLLANKFADTIKSIGPIDEKIIEKMELVDRSLTRINYLIDIINEKFGTNIPKIKENDALVFIKTLTEYTPAIRSYHKLYEAAGKLPSNNDFDYLRFYVSLGLLMAGVGIIEMKLGYKVAFKSTGEIASILRLYKLRKVLGNKGYALLLSEIHWYFRDLFNETLEYLKELLRNLKASKLNNTMNIINIINFW